MLTSGFNFPHGFPNDDDNHHSANDNLMVIDSSDADKPASATNHLPQSNSHTCIQTH